MRNRSRIYTIKLNRERLILFGIIILTIIIVIIKSFSSSKIFNYENQPNIVIDPGHGGIDGGTGNKNDILEKDINLDVGLKLKKELLVEGYHIIMTREKDESLENLSSIKSSRYRRDLDARKSIVNENHPLAFVSIHVNSSKKPQAQGIKIYYFPGSVEGEKLAKAIAQAIDEYVYGKFLKDANIKSEVLSENYYILRETQYPGVLVEIGFITNPEENKLLKNEGYKGKVAYAIKKGIVNYLK